jgi:hypothetical protein
LVANRHEVVQRKAKQLVDLAFEIEIDGVVWTRRHVKAIGELRIRSREVGAHYEFSF